MKKLVVKETEVQVNETTLVFTKDNEEITLDRRIGMSDYRIVYNYLKLKNPQKQKDVYSVGNFNYKINDENQVTIYSTNYNFENAFEFNKDEHKNAHQKLRNEVINFLLKNID